MHVYIYITLNIDHGLVAWNLSTGLDIPPHSFHIFKDN